MMKQRELIEQALKHTSVAEIRFNKNDIPKELPAAIICMEAEDGKLGTSRRYTSTDISWVVFLIVNAQKVEDPDQDLWNLKEELRAQLIERMGRDIPKIEYYDGRMGGARLVRVARLELLRPGSGAGS